MKRYQVFEGGTPADSKSITEISKGKGWDNSIFNSIMAASAYAYAWTGRTRNMDEALISIYSKQLPLLLINTPTDLSICEFPVMMEIREVS